MMFRRLTGGLVAAAAVGLMSVVPVAANASTTSSAGRAAASACCMGGTYLEAGLHGSHGYSHAGGHAAYQSWNRHRELHVRMWNLRSLHGRVLVVYIHGTRVGSMRVTRGGDAYLNRYHGVRACRSGEAIRVRTQDGTLVATGTFRGHHHGGM